MRAWVIEWRWVDARSAIADPLIDILSARRSVPCIQEYIERLHIQRFASLREKIDLASYAKPVTWAYRAEIKHKPDGSFEVHCGDDPFIVARRCGVGLMADSEGNQSLHYG